MICAVRDSMYIEYLFYKKSIPISILHVCLAYCPRLLSSFPVLFTILSLYFSNHHQNVALSKNILSFSTVAGGDVNYASKGKSVIDIETTYVWSTVHEDKTTSSKEEKSELEKCPNKEK